VAYHRRELARAGVRPRLAADREAETGSIVIMVGPDGQRTMYTDRGANLRLRRADVPARLLDGAAALHLTGYTFCEPPLLEVALWLLGQARARGLAVTIDPGSAAFLARMDPAAFLAWTEGAAVCFPNRDEAAVLTGEADPLAMAARLTRYYGAVVVKLGAAGCVLAVPGEAPVPIPARPARATDTTGAGDAFCGAFLSRWLAAATDPSTREPSTTEPSTTEPSTTEPSTTEPSTTEPSTTNASVPGVGAAPSLPVAPGQAIPALVAAAEFATRVAATVVTRFGARPV
jgi:sugar/nucleoside kinase (ribokinase family)